MFCVFNAIIFTFLISSLLFCDNGRYTCSCEERSRGSLVSSAKFLQWTRRASGSTLCSQHQNHSKPSRIPWETRYAFSLTGSFFFNLVTVCTWKIKFVFFRVTGLCEFPSSRRVEFFRVEKGSCAWALPLYVAVTMITEINWCVEWAAKPKELEKVVRWHSTKSELKKAPALDVVLVEFQPLFPGVWSRPQLPLCTVGVIMKARASQRCGRTQWCSEARTHCAGA